MRQSTRVLDAITALRRGFTVDAAGVVRSPAGRVLRGGCTSTGYRRISAREPSTRRHMVVLVHLMQALTKFGPSAVRSGTVVRHLNGNRLDNTAANVEIGTPQDNALDIPLATRQRSAMCAARAHAKLTDLDAQRVREERWPLRTIMTTFGVAKTTASYVRSGKTYKDLSGKWAEAAETRTGASQ